MAHMGVLAWIVLGLVSGFIANKLVNKAGGGVVADLLLGVAGALIGGFVVERVPAFDRFFGGLSVMGFALGPLAIAVLGSILVLVLHHMLFRRGR